MSDFARSLGRVLLGIAGLLVLATWTHALTSFGGAAVADFFATWVYDGVVFIAAIVLFLRAATSARSRVAWLVLGVGVLLHGAGDVVYSSAPNLDEVPVPSVSDPLWLAIYPCAYFAVLALIHRRVGRTLLAARLDGMVSGLAAASLLASVSLPLAVHATAGASFWETTTNLAYTVGDLVLLGVVVSAIVLTASRLERIWVLLGTAVIAWEAADLMYLFNVTGAAGHAADALVTTGTLMMAATAHLDRGRAVRRDATGGGLFMPVAFGAIALGVLAAAVPLDIHPVAGGLAAGALLLALGRMGLAVSENERLLRKSQVEASTDALTGLPNRRQMKLDLRRLEEEPGCGTHALVLLDLNGFKGYNDSYGHGAGDALLSRLGGALGRAVSGRGTAYRMGGDEFCVLAPCPAAEIDDFASSCASALATSGHGFSISAASGAVAVPDECADPSAALRIADTRMYQQKKSGRVGAAKQSAGVLIALVQERAPALAEHIRSVSELAHATGVELGLDDSELEAVRHAAELHDIGKLGIPDAILDKPGPLSPDEWELIRQHTLIGERILASAPALERSARLVRWSHERIDGEGYPDGLAGAEIPLAARIICATDAFDAMTSERPYRRPLAPTAALVELRRCAGTQFDAEVVEALARVQQRQAVPA